MRIIKEHLTSMKIIQCGFPKSGNSLLNKILTSCLEEHNIYRTFMLASGFSRMFEKMYEKANIKNMFDRSLEIDNIVDVNDEKVVLEVPFPDKELENIYVDITLFLNVTSLSWTHLKVSAINPLLFNFGLRFYMLRDGRDVVNSLIHANTSITLLKLRPEYRIKTVGELYNRYDIFESYVKKWHSHVMDFLRYRECFMEIRYEDLIRFGGSFDKILNIFKLGHKRDEFIRKYSFDSMKKESPLHLRKGKKGDWRNYFTEKHKEIFKEIAGDLLIELGYETSFDW